MTNTDIVLLIPLAWGACWGFYKGIISQVASLLAIFIAFYCFVHFRGSVSALLVRVFHNKAAPLFISVTAFVLIFLVVFVVLFLLVRQIEKLTKGLGLGTVNHIFGGIFGLLKWAFIASMVIYFFNVAEQRGHPLPFKFEHTWLYNMLEGFAPKILPGLI